MKFLLRKKRREEEGMLPDYNPDEQPLWLFCAYMHWVAFEVVIEGYRWTLLSSHKPLDYLHQTKDEAI